MSRPARTVLVFGVYAAGLGILLLVIPGLMLKLIGAEPTTDVWVRVLGVVVMVLGAYYIQAARHELVPFFRATVWGRAAGMVLFTLLALLGLGPPSLILFGVIDGAGGLWTALSLASRDRSG